jgi:hypothetical protein
MIANSIRVSARAVADFMTSQPSTQRRIVRTNKYRSGEEAKAIVASYRDARTATQRFFESEGAHCVLEGAICRISGLVAGARPARKTRLQQNIRAIQDFQKSAFAATRFQPMHRPHVELDIGGLALRVRPSLYLRDQTGHIHWVAVDFSDGQMDTRRAEILLQLFLQAARAEALDLEPPYAEYHHLHSGLRQVCRRHRARLEAQIAAACHTFVDIWTSM